MSIIETANSYESETKTAPCNMWTGFINSKKACPEVNEKQEKPKSSVESLFFALAEDDGDSDLDFDLLDEAFNMPVLSKISKTTP